MNIMSAVDKLNNSHLNHVIDDIQGYDCNCWGFTSIAMGWECQPDWELVEVHEERLAELTKPVSPEDVRVGDIIVCRGTGGEFLMHTGIVVELLPDGDIMILHKPGASALSLDPWEDDDNYFYYQGYGPVCEYRRAIN